MMNEIKEYEFDHLSITEETPEKFSFMEKIGFILITMTTFGYGDCRRDIGKGEIIKSISLMLLMIYIYGSSISLLVKYLGACNSVG